MELELAQSLTHVKVGNSSYTMQIGAVRNPLSSHPNDPLTSFGGVDRGCSDPTRVTARPTVRIGSGASGSVLSELDNGR